MPAPIRRIRRPEPLSDGTVIEVVDGGQKSSGKAKVQAPRGKSFTPKKVASELHVSRGNLEWLELALRFKYLTYEELAFLSGKKVVTVRNRALKLIKDGVLEGWKVNGDPTILLTGSHRAAKKYDLGYLIGSRDTEEPKASHLAHTSAMTRLAIDFLARFDRAETYILTEREIRTMMGGGDRVEQAALLVRDTEHWKSPPSLDPEQYLAETDSGFTYHPEHGHMMSGFKVPDLVVLRDEELPVAVEVELTSKGSETRKTILHEYQRAIKRHKKFSMVAYYCYSRTIFNEVKKAIEKAGLEDIIMVRMLDDDMPLPVTRTVRQVGRKIDE